MEVTATLSLIPEGFERLPVKDADRGEWDVPSGIVYAHDAARAVAALRLHSKLGLKRRTALVNSNTLVKLNEEWPADLPAPRASLEDLFVYAMELAQPAAHEVGQQAGPVARLQFPEQLQVGSTAGPRTSPISADAQFPEQSDPTADAQAFLVVAPTLGPNQVSEWIPYGKTALIAVWVNSPNIQQVILRVHSSTRQAGAIFQGTSGGTGALHTTDSKPGATVAGGVFISFEFNSRDDISHESWKPSRCKKLYVYEDKHTFGSSDDTEDDDFHSAVASATYRSVTLVSV